MLAAGRAAIQRLTACRPSPVGVRERAAVPRGVALRLPRGLQARAASLSDAGITIAVESNGRSALQYAMIAQLIIFTEGGEVPVVEEAQRQLRAKNVGVSELSTYQTNSSQATR